MAHPSGPGSSERSCCRSRLGSARSSRQTRRTSTTSIDGRSKISPHRSSYTCSIIGFLLLRWVGRDSQPRARLSQDLESPTDQLGPPIRELRHHLRVDGADGAKGKLEIRTLAAIAQLEGGNAERNAQVERPSQLQVAV